MAGYRVAVASDRRKHGLADLLTQLGARTIGVQASRSVPQVDESRLREATEEVLAGPCDELVVSSAFGLRAWFTAAGRWGLADALLARFREARLLTRDARAADSLREIGLTTIWSTAGATTEDLFRYLIAQPVEGRRIVVQADMVTLRESCRALRALGAEVVEVPTYQSCPPTYADHLRRLSDQIVEREIDAVALLGEPASEYLMAQASSEGKLNEMLNALSGDVICACLGAGTAEPFVAHGVHPLVGAAPYLEELAAGLVEALARTATRLTVGTYEMELRGLAVVLDGRLIPVQAGPLAVLRALAREPGRVVSYVEIRRSIPSLSDVDDHVIEMAVARLRHCLDGANVVQTIVRRGYRLAM